MGARDPVIDEDKYLEEAVEAIFLVVPEASPVSRLCALVISALLTLLDREPLHQSDLDALHEAFADAVDEMEA
jgi:hypothetical protein